MRLRGLAQTWQGWWHRRYSVDAWTDADEAVLADADKRMARAAALARLAVVAIIAITLVVYAAFTSLWNGWVAVVVLVYLAIGVCVSLMTYLHPSRFFSGWIMVVSDAVFLLCVGLLGPWFGSLPAGFHSALVSPWVAFLMLALTSIQQQARPLVCQTVLLTCGFALLIWLPDDRVKSDAIFAPLFSDGPNMVRMLILLLTGALLSVGAYWARKNLRSSIRTARQHNALRRFVPRELDGYLASAASADLRRGTRHHICVMFADVRGFTATSENMRPEDVVALLNRFRHYAEQSVAREGGIIDKFMGDGFLAVFGITAPKADDATCALKAATALVSDVAKWNELRRHEGDEAIAIGIGLHVGDAFVGAVGGEHRMEFTVIGDVVNVAQRLQDATREVGTELIMSKIALDAIGLSPTELMQWRELPGLVLRGRRKPISAFAYRST